MPNAPVADINTHIIIFTIKSVDFSTPLYFGPVACVVDVGVVCESVGGSCVSVVSTGLVVSISALVSLLDRSKILIFGRI